MPRGDRTGPEGMGPMTGRRFGYCNGYDSPGLSRGRMGGGYGRGLGNFRGSGMGRRFGYGFAANQAEPQVTSAQSARYLEAEITALQEELKAKQAHLAELENEE